MLYPTAPFGPATAPIGGQVPAQVSQFMPRMGSAAPSVSSATATVSAMPLSSAPHLGGFMVPHWQAPNFYAAADAALVVREFKF